ncbi:DUF2500 family protein [Caloramator australicus]|uniref:DUF2500 domain-containing protein n=1 Tax=Caloramator australicus RC3 TaxID=857293 RepID=G0V3N8_9CLOT|nr:DUF2500 family protein [Caloramator australicus]CCC57728.1 hypothetical protein CAAU_0078 [Caloramator australicus RC3]
MAIYFFTIVIQYIITILMAIIIFLILIRYLKNLLSPVKTIRAKVIDKKAFMIRTVNIPYHVSRNLNRTKFSITFETEGGKTIELLCNNILYDGIFKGEEGYLTYQGEWLKDFRKNESFEGWAENEFI